MSNPVFHFEIPVLDMDRAISFYQTVFGLELRREPVDGYEMAFFPRDDASPGASGALAKGDIYQPSHQGAVLYFDVPDIERFAAAMGHRAAYVETLKFNAELRVEDTALEAVANILVDQTNVSAKMRFSEENERLKTVGTQSIPQ